jgi:hypothetical protein
MMFYLRNPYLNPYSNPYDPISIETTFYKRVVQGILDLIGIVICFISFGVVYLFMVLKNFLNLVQFVNSISLLLILFI